MEEVVEIDAAAGEINRRMRRKVVRTLEDGKKRQEGLVEELARLERQIFPKHESLAESLDKEVQKRNVGVLYALEDDYGDDKHPADNDKQSSNRGRRAVAGYIMYSYASVMASITKLAVRESCRRQGYGEVLVKTAMHKARSKGVLCVNLHVDPLRTPALSLYRKLGFEVDTVVHSYYAPGRDAYRMIFTFHSGSLR